MKKFLLFFMLFAAIGVALAQTETVPQVKTGIELFYATLKNIGIVLFTLLGFTLWKSQSAILSNEFSVKVFFGENYRRWVYVIMLVLSLIFIDGYAPESLAVVTGFMGISLTAGPGSWATVTVLLLTSIKGVGRSADTKRSLRKIRDINIGKEK